ncbi:sensor histidine kinase [Chitinophaga japonensis]|uniref:histidine kinase n=1 Tax=Chitinophaga japonensis TaxID=104662 RepID=A0A562SRZ5_CHIJA|nr:HAMP domain-containing sensor histidine kinase [Chitinophaga japonensis]TWI84029.1 signal transduction histidine kinase [Chitinophaga japonensis]
MKLVDKFTLWFIAITFLVTPITSYFFCYTLVKKIDSTETARLSEVNATTASRLGKGLPANVPGKGGATDVQRLTTALPQQRTQVRKTDVYNGGVNGMESLLTVDSYVTINGGNYRISSYNYIPSSRQVISTILGTITWKLLLIVLCVVITARLVSQRILSSLRQTMKLIQGFNVKRKVQFPKTGTREFRELNAFLQKMTDKAVDEYAAVKEFSENASHELQTPLAILRNKLELLSETNIGEEQAALLGDMQNAIEKLTKINRSLTLLARMENNEYAVSENIKFCRVVKDVLSAYEDRIELKNLSVRSDFEKNVLLKIHPVLADMLINNLLGNAVRHNVQDGHIDISLTQRKLEIRNTGLPPEMPTHELFQRFKKSNQCSESVGLGLSIVKQICEVCGFYISYHYSDQLHTVTVQFRSQPREAVRAVPGVSLVNSE